MSAQNLLSSFNFSHWPEIHYGAGVLQDIASALPQNSQQILWVTGGRSGFFQAISRRFCASAVLRLRMIK